MSCSPGRCHRRAGVTVGARHPRLPWGGLGAFTARYSAALVSFLGWERCIQAVLMAAGTSSPAPSLCPWPGRRPSLCGCELETEPCWGLHAVGELKLVGFAQSCLLQAPGRGAGSPRGLQTPGWSRLSWRVGFCQVATASSGTRPRRAGRQRELWGLRLFPRHPPRPPPRGQLWNWIRILFKCSFFAELEG